jgi:type IV pilus assembly protein PilM
MAIQGYSIPKFINLENFKIPPGMQAFLDQYFSFVRKFLPMGPQKSVVGLDIGIRRCKMVELLRVKKGFKVINWAIEPVQGTDVTSSVKNLLKKIGSESKDIYTSVSGQGTLIRFIKMPRMPLSELQESLVLEADKYFPFPANEIHMACQIIEDKRIKENKISVLVAVAKKDVIKERLNFLSSLSIQSDIIGLDAVAISNAILELQKNDSERTNGKHKEVFAVLDLGETKTTVVVFRDNAPRFTREISIGGKDLSQKIAEVLGCNAQDAEKMKTQPDGRDEEVFAACQGVLSNLVSEIRLSLDYFSSEDSSEIKPSSPISPEGGSQVSKVFLTGDNAKLVKIKEYFSKELEIPVEIWAPSADLEFSGPSAKNSFFDNINQLPVALGLAVMIND